KGDLSKKITVDVKGEILELKLTVNTMVDQLNAFAAEVTRVAREVGTEGKLGGQAQVVGVAGVWKDLTDNVNFMAANLTGQVRNIAEVTTAVAKGDLSKKITVDVKGEVLELKSTVNTMVDQLNAFAAEVTRVAREVGTEGKLGGQASVRGVGGVWKDLTDNVNSMAANLTSQVRGIANVVTAVASGDLDRKLTVEAKGEIAALADTINGMIDTLATFAEQVTNVAREVGIEGKLGGQARVPGAAGLWRDLTENVNRLAANLTAQVRAIAEVATAVTKGDLTRSITVEAQGEVASLKDNINEMIRNLKDTTRKNTEQDWLKTHLARFTRMLQGHRDLVTVSRLILSELTPLVNAQQAAFYVADHRSGDSTLELLAGYAQRHSKSLPRKIAFGEGLVGQCAFEKKRIVLSQAPSDYIRIGSSLGSGAPVNIVILPVLFEGQVKAVIELAACSRVSVIPQRVLEQLAESRGVVLHTIAANMQTEYLLHQSQSLTAELQAQQEELKKTNDRLEQQALNLQKSEALLKSKQDELRAANEQLQEKARQLSEQMHQVEFKNREIEQARAALEEKAEQLSLSSRYKSEFLANMSHELRTPLNSLLILARLLADNVGGNLTPKQVEFARTIHSSGAELLALINDILDLAKIESGTVTLNITQEPFRDVVDYVERTFRQMAADKGLEFQVSVDPALPASLDTDAKRLQQIVTNLLSNAFKFTTKGSVKLKVERAKGGWSPGHPVLDHADAVVSFSVADTGIGIPLSKQRLIFEAFQQADGTTSREYGGTGLGLSISRELARLLGGEIRVQSAPGQGSTFTLYLPLAFQPGRLPRQTEVLEGSPVLPPAPPPREAGAPPPREAEPAPAQAGVAGRKVLVVDDDIRNVFALTSALEAHGMRVLHADSGKEGIELLKRTPDVDIVLMDVMMPGLDGLDTMRIVRQLEGYRSLPIIAVTAKAMMGDREKCLEAGANEYLAKPVNVDELIAALAKAAPAHA
ncbi:MAG: HAMP domain-containing protein, partial [Betaproteobacteria bacterium]